MPREKRIRIFLGSPGDVPTERKLVRKVVNELNEVVGREKNVFFDLYESRDAYPGYGSDGQDIINQQIGRMREYDIVLVIMWNRIGTPTPRDISGTVEEFHRAVEARKRRKKPDIWLFFRTGISSRVKIDPVQQKEVGRFKQQIRGKGLFREFQGPSQFEETLRKSLQRWLADQVSTPATGKQKTTQREESVVGAKQTPTQPKSGVASGGLTRGTARTAGKGDTDSVTTERKPLVVKAPDKWVMLNNAFFRADSTVVELGRRVVIKVTPTSLEEADAIRSLQPLEFRSGTSISYADRHEAGTATVQSVTSESRGNKTTFTVTLGPLASAQNSSVITDMSVNGYSPDVIAEHRARYILLGESPPSRIESTVSSYHQWGASGRSRGDLPDTLLKLWPLLRSDTRSFPYKAWLFASYVLKTRGVVENVTALELGPLKSGTMKVKFQGRRKAYPGQDAVAIKVEGECRLEV